MLNLKQALKLTNNFNNENIVYLENMGGWYNLKEIKNKFDMKKIHVYKIEPKFSRYDFEGMAYWCKF